MTQYYEPMNVTIVHDEEGRSSWPEPTHYPGWSRIDSLRWTAGVIKARTGITIKFNDGSKCSGPGYAYEWPELIGVNIEGTSCSVMDSEMDRYLRGVHSGADAVLHMQEKAGRDA